MKHVLFVHDHQEDPARRREALEACGFRVTACDGGSEALEALDRESIDLVLMDVLLRGRHGFDVCRDIRRRFSARELPVILCTTIYRRDVFREEAWAAGAQGYLAGNVDLENVVQHVLAAVSAKEKSLAPG